MKSWKIVVILLLCLTLAGAVACMPFRGGGDEEESTSQLVEVVRGNLTVSVSGAGNIAVANEENLTFESSSGKVNKIWVEVGDEVSEGQLLAVLAPLDTEALELALTRAQVALATAEYNLDKTKIYTDEEIEEKEDEIDEAEDYVDFAEDMRAQAQREGDAVESVYWRREVYQAQADLEALEDELVAMLAPSDEDEIKLMEMEVDAAKQAVEEAQRQLDIETITAPWDGVVADVGAKVGDTFYSSAAAGTVIVRLIDLTSMELNVDLDEIDIPGIGREQRAIVEIDALPDVQLEGRVISVSPVPTVEAGVVLYNVKIDFDVPQDSNLKVGMSATADIIINERSSVLLVPDRAIKQDRQGNPIVLVMVDEQIEARPVVIGISDGFQTEIVGGLSEGETVVLEMGAGVQPSPEPAGRPGVIPFMPGPHPGPTPER